MRRENMIDTEHRIEAESPYKNLQQSPYKTPSKILTKEINRLDENKQPRNPTLKKDEYDKRLEEIRKKYTSSQKSARNISTPMALQQINIPSTNIQVPNQSHNQISKEKYSGKIRLDQVKKSIGPVFQSQFSKLSTPKFQYSKRATDDQRIRSITKINQRIKTMLDSSLIENDFKQTEQTKKSFINETSIFDIQEQTKKQKRSFLGTSLDNRATKMNKSYIDSVSDTKALAKEFDHRMQQIHNRIKRSEANRRKITDIHEVKQPVTSRAPEKKIEDQSLFKRQRSTTTGGMYSHRYMSFGKNLSKNILQELQSLNKTNIQSKTPSVKIQTPRLISLLVQQIKLDQQSRNGKVCLETNLDPTKWSKIRQILSRKLSKSFSQSQIKEIFICAQRDHNPFYVSQPNQTIQTIVQKYLTSQQHWKSKIFKKIDVKKLKQQGFSNDQLDLQLKGYLQIQDIVRYLNIETGKFYRNRDLIAIFVRMTKSNKLAFEDFVKNIEA